VFIPVADLPDTVVGFTASGEIHADDYKETLIPAVEGLIQRAGAARVVLVLGPEWEGYSAAAMFEDLKLGIEHRNAWQRFALVSDAEWIQHVAALFGWMVPGTVRWFPYSDLEDAKLWVCA